MGRLQRLPRDFPARWGSRQPESDYIYSTDQTVDAWTRSVRTGCKGRSLPGTRGVTWTAGSTARFNNPMGLTRDDAGLDTLRRLQRQGTEIVDPNGPRLVHTITAMSNRYGISDGGFEGRPGSRHHQPNDGNVYLYDIGAGALRLIKSFLPNISGVAVLNWKNLPVSNQTHSPIDPHQSCAGSQSIPGVLLGKRVNHRLGCWVC